MANSPTYIKLYWADSDSANLHYILIISSLFSSDKHCWQVAVCGCRLWSSVYPQQCCWCDSSGSEETQPWSVCQATMQFIYFWTLIVITSHKNMFYYQYIKPTDRGNYRIRPSTPNENVTCTQFPENVFIVESCEYWVSKLLQGDDSCAQFWRSNKNVTQIIISNLVCTISTSKIRNRTKTPIKHQHLVEVLIQGRLPNWKKQSTLHSDETERLWSPRGSLIAINNIMWLNHEASQLLSISQNQTNTLH